MMKQRPLGQTGLSIPELILGGGFVGGVMIDPPEDVRREALQRCLAAGSNWIDTAQSYGNGQSETNIGRLLGELPSAERPRISTKINLSPEDLKDPKAAVQRALEGSLERLGLGQVQVYQLHNRIGYGSADRMLTPYEILKPGGIADAFQAVREAGLTEHIGITALGETGPVRDVIASRRFQTAQVYYNLLNSSSGHNVEPRYETSDFRGLLGACKANGVGVFGIRILAAGVLATNERHGREIPITPNSTPAEEQARAERAWAALGPRNEPHAATAVRYALAEDRLSAAVFGAATLEHVDIALNAAAAGPLEQDAITRLSS
ncbi:MAG: aldo/keto reductase [Alphaproteobacteria bacterium]